VEDDAWRETSPLWGSSSKNINGATDFGCRSRWSLRVRWQLNPVLVCPLTCFPFGWIVGILEKPFVKPEPGVGCRMGYVYGTVTPPSIFRRSFALLARCLLDECYGAVATYRMSTTLWGPSSRWLWASGSRPLPPSS